MRVKSTSALNSSIIDNDSRDSRHSTQMSNGDLSNLPNESSIVV